MVADEVRALSQRIQRETHAIQQQVKQLQNGTSNAVSAMQRGREKTEKSAELTAKAGAALESITSSVAHITVLNNNIASATQEENQRLNGLTNNTDTVRHIADQMADSAKRASKSGHEFKSMANQLQGLVQQILLSQSNTDSGTPENHQHNSPTQENSVELF